VCDVRRSEPTDVYRIRDPQGRFVAEKYRFDKPDGDKDMLWKLPGAGLKDWGLHGTPLASLPLYGSEYGADWNKDDLIVLVEGEKARDFLVRAGLPAVGTVTGASGTPGTAALEVLRDRRVCLWPDGDDAGRKHMERVAEGLHSVAAEVLVYTWHDAPEEVKGPDAADHPAVLSKVPEALDRLLTDLEGAPRWEPTGTSAKAEPKTFSAADLMARKMAPPRWAVPGLVPEGVTVLAGKPKLGKSWLALGLCVATAIGGSALGMQQVEQGSCLYLALEDNPRRLQKRLKKLLVGDAAPAELYMATEWRRLNEGGAEDLERWLEGHPDCRLVIIDTLARFKPRTAGRRTQYDEDRDAVDPLIPIAAEHGVAIILVHHLREMESDDPLDMITGSVGLTGGVDGALVLKRRRGRANAELHADGRDIEKPVELALKWDARAATWTIIGDAEEYRLSERRRMILTVLENADEALGPKDITEILNAKGVDIKCGAVRELLSQMAKDGQVKNLGRGQYIHPDNLQNIPDNADNLTNSERMSGVSERSDEDEVPWKMCRFADLKGIAATMSVCQECQGTLVRQDATMSCAAHRGVYGKRSFCRTNKRPERRNTDRKRRES
jgi:hypothetical protein